MDLTPAELLERDQRALTEAQATGVFQPYEKEYFRKDGSRVPVLTGGALFQSEDEGVVFVLDLSERKRAEQKIREQESALRQIVDLVPQLVVVFGPGGECLYANRIALDYVGLSGRIEAEDVNELRDVLALETTGKQLVLDLRDVTLVNEEAVEFLARCEADTIKIANCPLYIRKWIDQAKG
jgi:PAS domain-containing protein